MKRSKQSLWFDYRFMAAMKAEGLPLPVKEHKFDEARRWKFDYAWPDRRIALECEGAVWAQGRHNRPQGFINDCEKYNRATLQGWRVFRVPSDMVDEAVRIIKLALMQTMGGC